MQTNCCYNCPRRKVGCHSTCEDYIAFKKERDAFNENKMKDFGNYRPWRRYLPRSNSSIRSVRKGDNT